MNNIFDSFLNSFATVLATKGFDPSRKGQSFHKNTHWGRWVIHVAYVKKQDYLELTVDVAIRVDEVCDLVFGTDTSLSKSQIRDTATVGAELGNITGNGPLVWKLTTREDISRIVISIMDACEKIGFPFLERYSDLEYLFKTLNNHGQDAVLLDPLSSYRCMSIVALARMLKVDLIDEIIDSCISILEKNQFELLQFTDFLQRNGIRSFR